MSDDLFYKAIRHGSGGLKGISIHMNIPPHISLQELAFDTDVARRLDEFLAEVNYVLYRTDPTIMAQAKAEKVTIAGFFKDPIYIESVPNQYDNTPYGRCFPWYCVTTEVGKFIVGRRKRVYSIDWSLTTGQPAVAETLFADEDVTKSTYMIHAWSNEAAARYIKRIIEARKGQ